MICIDPGKDCGVAVFDNGELTDCFLWDGKNGACDDQGIPIRLPVPMRAEDVVVEDQVVYPRTKNPQSIVELAKQAGRVAQIFGWETVQWVQPRAWKGTVDGDLMTVRILQQLDEEERRVYFAATDKLPEGVRHNVADAVGLGLWKLGRLTAAKVAANKKTRSKRK